MQLDTMDLTQEDNYLQKITELVYDDNEIVTSTILGNILKIKVDYAQALLEKYVQNADVPGQTDISWTYLIIGKNENNISVVISKYNEIDEKKQFLKNVISQKVYSVQKNPDIDIIALANVEPIAESNVKNNPLLGSVVSRNAIKRKLKAVPKPVSKEKSEIKEPIKQNGSSENIKIKKSGIENFCTKGSTQNSNSTSTSNAKLKPKNIMTNFFSKDPVKTQSINGHNFTSKQTEKGNIVNKDLGNNISTNMVCEDDAAKDCDLEEKQMEIDNEPEVQKENEIEIKKDISTDKKSVSNQNKKSKKRHTQSKSDQPSKKRKRIIEANDSDSDIFASSESEIEVVPDINISDDNYEEEKIIETPLPTKTRRMKQVTEEFMDEDGYINTVQKYVMVSDDEADENKEQKPLNAIPEKTTVDGRGSNKNKNMPPVKKEISPRKPAKSNKGKVSKGHQNQTSIMNFFKKT